MQSCAGGRLPESGGIVAFESAKRTPLNQVRAELVRSKLEGCATSVSSSTPLEVRCRSAHVATNRLVTRLFATLNYRGARTGNRVACPTRICRTAGPGYCFRCFPAPVPLVFVVVDFALLSAPSFASDFR